MLAKKSDLKTYYVYFADERDNREFIASRRVVLSARNRVEAYCIAFDEYPGVIKWGMVEEFGQGISVLEEAVPEPTWGEHMIAEHGVYSLDEILKLDEHNAPKPAPSAGLAPVQVSWWQSGARKGLFSQMQYEVLSQDETWVTVSLMGKPKAVRREYTRSAAA